MTTKMESTLFVPVNLSFSENLRCLKMPLLVGAISQKRWPSETCFVFAGQNVNSGKFKHLKYSENVKFTGTNYIDSILESTYCKHPYAKLQKVDFDHDYENHIRHSPKAGFNFTLEGTLLPGAGFESTSSLRH